MFNYETQARDNTCNNENDFSADFTWTVWTDENDGSGDWVWNRETAYVAICRHLGGDVRGNYGSVSLHRLDSDCVGDSGFFDWVLGWHVERVENVGNCQLVPEDLDDWDDDWATLVSSLGVEDERLTERCSIGYASLPSSELWKEAGTDNCYWFSGKAILKLSDGSGWLVATPYHYSDCEITTPKNGSGWLCDASIDTDSFVENVLGECILDELGERSAKLLKWIESLDWDCDETIAKLCRADRILSEVC